METNSRDEELWRLAKKRAKFQRSLVSYFIINAFLWAIWWFTGGHRDVNSGMPWPVWVMAGWGIGLAFQYLDAYGGNRESIAQKEYDKLKRDQK